MALDYILRKFNASVGNNSPELNTELRTKALETINEAAAEIWSELDLPLSLKECTIRALSDTRLALPGFVDKVRAIRSTRYNDQWSLKDIRARYSSVDWPEKWNKGRIIGEVPFAVEPDSAAPGTIEYKEADADLIITIVGSTIDSNRAYENITLSGALTDGIMIKEWTTSFLEIQAIRKNKVTDYNVIIKDAAGNEIAIIYADQLESIYKIMDISQYPALIDCGDGSFFLEVLYKPKLPRLENDSDSFPLSGYDDIIVLRAKQLIAEENEGQEQRALLMNAKSKSRISSKVEDEVGTTEKELNFRKPPMQGYFRRQMWGRRDC